MLTLFMSHIISKLAGGSEFIAPARHLTAEGTKPEDVCRWVTDFRPKYQKPRDDRVWVWFLTLSAFAPTSFKDAFSKLFSLVLPSISVEPRRISQDGLT